MTYGLKYQANFYNYFHKLVSIKIYKEGYAGEVTDMKVSSATITNNYQDDNTPIVGKGAKVVIIADTADMAYLEDLLLSYEREFLGVIEYDGQVAFRGFTLCDLNERQLLPYAVVTVEFTDYVHRLDGSYSSLLKNMGGYTNLLSLVQDFLIATDLELPLYVNSTLFEDSMDDGSAGGDTWLPQVCVQNSVFYNDSFTYGNMYEAINKSLNSFSAFLYSHNDKWVIERQEDITRDGTWVLYEGESDEVGRDTGVAVTSLKQEINKQNGDFEYVECSQHIEYNSGLHTLILRLQNRLCDTLVFNDWPAPNSILKEPSNVWFGTPDTLQYRTWYVNQNIVGLRRGEDHNGIDQWVYWDTSAPGASLVQGLHYQFAVYFNTGTNIDTILDIVYKMSTDESMQTKYGTCLGFLLRIDGGSHSGEFITYGGPIDRYADYWGLGDPKKINIIEDDAKYSFHFYNGPMYDCVNRMYVDVSDETTNTWTMTKTFNLTRSPIRRYSGNMGSFQNYADDVSLWDYLGNPEYQKFVIIFMPAWYTNTARESFLRSPDLYQNQYLGDIKVTVNAEEINNQITYVLNKDFVKTEEVNIHLFDMKNMNYSNALLLDDGLTRTDLWVSENSTTPIPLYEVFAKCKFRKYGRTIHDLKATILYDGILKPFTVITDDTIVDSSDSVISFLLNTFTWDLYLGQYQVEAEEYTEEEVVVDGLSEYDSMGEFEINDSPTLSAIQLHNWFFKPVIVWWTMVSSGTMGITGYILERKPYFKTIGFQDDWIQIYDGKALLHVDDIHSQVPSTMWGDRTYTYRVRAYRKNVFGPWSSEVSVNWIA